MTDFPQLKMKVLPTFPSSVSGGPGIDVNITAGAYSIQLDYSEFGPPINVVSDPNNTLALVWNQVTLQYSLLTAASVFGAPTNNPTFTGTVTINGNLATSGGTVSMTGAVTITGTLGISGALTDATTITATGAITGGSIATAGSVLSSGQAGIGYTTGAGGAVTQITSRTTAVVLNKITGAITLFTAAPVVGTWFSFTVTNSSVAVTDTVSVSVKSATNTYNAIVSQVGAGSFQISMVSVVGTTSDAPVVNFNVIKGSIT